MFKNPKDERTKLLKAVVEAIEDHELKTGSTQADFERGTIQINLTFKIKGAEKK